MCEENKRLEGKKVNEINYIKKINLKQEFSNVFIWDALSIFF